MNGPVDSPGRLGAHYITAEHAEIAAFDRSDFDRRRVGVDEIGAQDEQFLRTYPLVEPFVLPQEGSGQVPRWNRGDSQ